MKPEFRIRQDNMTVAGANSEGEILHYAQFYRRGGDLTIQVKHELKSGSKVWRRHMFMAKYPQDTIKGAE